MMTRSGGESEIIFSAAAAVEACVDREFGMERQLFGKRFAQVFVVIDDEDLSSLAHGLRSTESNNFPNYIGKAARR